MTGGTGGIGPWAERLAHELEEAVRRPLAGPGACGVAFSGGIDSSLVAYLAARNGSAVTLYTVGLPGARDSENSKPAAEALGLRKRHQVIELGGDEVLEAAARIRTLVPGATLLQVSFLAPAFIVFERAAEHTILTGDGADELFGGYHRYLSMDAAKLAASLEHDAGELVFGGLSRNRRLAVSAKKELVAPYLDPRVVELAGSIPPHMKVLDGERKAVLRRAAALLGLPPELCNIPKRAAQYGSGFHAFLSKQSVDWQSQDQKHSP